MTIEKQTVTMKKENLAKIAEGKTKEIYSIHADNTAVFVKSKDDITAFNAQRKNNVEGKGAIANRTTCNVFEYLNCLGIKTHFICRAESSDGEGFLAKRCNMIPIEWVARRVATGSYLKRNPGVKEGYRFNPPKIEIFFKDDANDDPQWSFDQLLAAEFHTFKIDERDVEMMIRTTELVFRVLEKAWATEDCALIDMKIEFGITDQPGKHIVVADVIDNDSWRVWPAGDRRLQLDKQFYRDLKEVNDTALLKLKENYDKVAQITKNFIRSSNGRVVIVMGSESDMGFADKIADKIEQCGIWTIKRVASAHKSTAAVIKIIADYEGDGIPTVFVAVAGRSNGLGPVIAGNSILPVINAPPCDASWAAQDIWSSLRVPSGLGCSTVLGADEAALAALKMFSNTDHMIYGRLLVSQHQKMEALSMADKKAGSS